ncbi:hypothetical protein [Marixanthomonas ophiurae]|uniref:Uncharacterized protein n=1 Tax=Marixanthomonas ophiurae TaxID=387659 RepID=A0A3E1Q9K2_9FLAO|nr:hypothetical protein [Marixanthomonas ophiurae]RFN58810.1 hypothetical protein DZ858_01640 [Marixanthomonas ophiurae]
MKNLIVCFTAFFVLLILNSCNEKRDTTFKKFDVGTKYLIDLPNTYSKTNETTWQAGEHTYFNISMGEIGNSDLKTELNEHLTLRNTKDLFENSELIRTEEFEKSGFKGVISFYEEDLKKQGVGIVTLTSYGVFAIVRNNREQFTINSMALSDNNFAQIAKSIKSIEMKEKTLNIPFANKFNKNEAIEDGYQVFQKERFMVKCNKEIKLDRLRIQQMKQNGMNDNSRPFHVYDNGTDYNINVSSFDKVLAGQTEQEIIDFNKNDLDYYQAKFDEMSIKNNRGKYKKFDAVYYENTQNGRTTKAVFFHHKMKSYMLQVTDDNNVEKKFQEFIKTFEII